MTFKTILTKKSLLHKNFCQLNSFYHTYLAASYLFYSTKLKIQPAMPWLAISIDQMNNILKNLITKNPPKFLRNMKYRTNDNWCTRRCHKHKSKIITTINLQSILTVGICNVFCCYSIVHTKIEYRKKMFFVF